MADVHGERRGSGEHEVSRRHPLARVLRKLPLLVWLVIVWVLLWGTFDAGTVIFGAVVAVLVVTVFPAPPIVTNLFVRPHRAAQLMFLLGWDLLISTARVAWQALWHRRATTAGIVAVRLATDSDHLTAMVASAVSLAPGNFVMQIDRANRVCYVYVLGMSSDDAEAVRRDVLGWERRVVRAVGSAAEVALVEKARRDAAQQGRRVT